MEQLPNSNHLQLGSSSDTPKKSKLKEALRMRIRNLKLLLASAEGNFKELESIINQGADIDFKDIDGSTCLHFAAENGNIEIFKLLFNKGARHVRNKANESPVDVLKRLCRYDILRFIETVVHLKYKNRTLAKNPISKQGEEKANSSDKSKQVKGGHHIHGSIYQLKLLMLFLYRGITCKYSFSLGTEIDEAKKFDDLVFEYTRDGIKEYRLLQAKHKLDESKKITKGSLLQEGDGDYSLVKYFFSYHDLKKEELFKDGKIRDVTVCTNIDFDPKLSIGIEPKTDKDDILDVEWSQKKPMRYKFKEDVIPDLKKYILAFNITRLASRLAKCFLQNDPINDHEETDIFKSYHTALAEEVIGVRNKKFHDKFIEGRIMSLDGQKFRDKFIEAIFSQSKGELTLENINEAIVEKKQIKNVQVGLNLSENFGVGQDRSWPDNAISDEEIREFLDVLVFAVNQPNEEELGKIIKNEITRNEIDLDIFTIEDLYNKLYVDMMHFLEGRRKDRFITHEEGMELLEEFRKGIPLWFGISKPVDSFTGRIKQLEDLHKALQSKGATAISQTASISGLGGIGKTELVRKYIQRHSQNYDNKIVWINAATYQTLIASFHRLAQDKLRISLKDENGKPKKIESVVRDVYRSFSKGKCLFIFDNAEIFDQGIDTFLPPLGSKPDGIYIVITSRNQSWGDIEVMLLDKFTEVEAKTFLRNSLKIEDSSHESDIEELVGMLQYFPLALQQAAAYIKAVRTDAKPFSICDYIGIYKEEARALLDFEFPDDSCDLYMKTTFTTWKITIETIRNDPKYGQKAAEVLDIMAFLAPDNISREIFLGAVSEDEEELKYAVRLLKQYSMINSEQEDVLLNIHRLVQQVIRINLRDQSKEQRIIDKAFRLLIEYFPLGSEQIEDFNTKRQLLPHLEALKSHMDDWVTLKPEDKQRIEENYFEHILLRMCNGYSDFGHPQREKELLEQALEIQKKRYGYDNLKVAETLANLGKAFFGLGNPQKSKDLYELALEIQKKHYGSDNFRVADTLVNLSNAYGELGDLPTQKMLLEGALPIQEKHYGLDHFQVARTLVNLGDVYGSLGRHEEQKILLERALKIKENYYGCDHFLLAASLTNLGIAYGDLGDVREKKELLKRALAIEEKHYGSNNYQVANTLLNLGNAYGALGHFEKQKELLERALVLQKKHYGQNHFKLFRTLVSLGNVYDSLGNCEKPKQMFERALAIQEQHYPPDHFELAQTIGSLGNAYGDLGDPHKQKELLERALAIQKKHYGPDHLQVAKTLTNLSNAYSCLGFPQKQKDLLETALAIKEKYFGPNHIFLALTLGNLGCAYGVLGNTQKQKEALERTLEIKQKHFGSDHIEVSATLANLSHAYMRLGLPLKQKENLERALAIQEKHYGPDHPVVAITLGNLGSAYGSLGYAEKKKELLERSLLIKEKYYGVDHFQSAGTLVNLGNAYGALGDLEKKKEFIERALIIREKHYGPDHFEVAQALVRLSETLGDIIKQHELLERALAIQVKFYGNYHFQVTETLLLLSKACGGLGDLQRQIVLLEWALKIQEKYYGRNHFQLVGILEDLGNVYGAVGDNQKQEGVRYRALQIQRKHGAHSSDRERN